MFFCVMEGDRGSEEMAMEMEMGREMYRLGDRDS
jgi:hypothetical protein